MRSDTEDALVVPRRALLSAFDPLALLPLAQGLASQGVELWGSSGTQKRLSAEGLQVHPTEEITGISSWFEHRVATLHPALFGGILAPRTAEGVKELEQRKVLPFDLVAVLFYPFESELAKGTLPPETLLEWIDVGGPSLLRAAAKNHRWVVPFSDPGDTESLLEELSARGGISLATRARLAAKSFRTTALHDIAVTSWLSNGSAAPEAARISSAFIALTPTGETLRYGENPHQPSQVMAVAGPPGTLLRPWPIEVLKGEALSYNNYLDLERSLALVSELDRPAAVVVKHATPCGAASAPTIEDACARALATDPVARYGCGIAVNAPLNVAAVDAMKGTFIDLLAGPDFPPQVQERLSKRPKLKLIQVAPPDPKLPRWEARTATGRVLLQASDQRTLKAEDLRPVTKGRASAQELRTADFAWRVVRHAKSNAVVLARGSETVGIGGGQTSRVGAVRLALEVAGPRAQGSVLASDAYFPFADGIEEAGKAGVKVILQPGGSIRDREVIEMADRHGIAMYFTGWRVFRH